MLMVGLPLAFFDGFVELLSEVSYQSRIFVVVDVMDMLLFLEMLHMDHFLLFGSP